MDAGALPRPSTHASRNTVMNEPVMCPSQFAASERYATRIDVYDRIGIGPPKLLSNPRWWSQVKKMGKEEGRKLHFN